jgi:hypothetical protein
MKLIIDYESSWRNSFLSGDNNEPLPKKGRDFVASMTNLRKEDNYISRDVTIDTVMGLLNRLIGDQRKLYQSRSHAAYYFQDMEQKVVFKDNPTYTSETVYIRNIKGSTDQNSFTGMVKSSDPLFDSDYAQKLWAPLFLDFESLCHFIAHETLVNDAPETLDPLSISAEFERLDKEKPVKNEGLARDAVRELTQHFVDTNYLTNKGEIKPSYLYCSALYLQLNRLAKQFDMTSAVTKNGTISGISKRGFTKKDFMYRCTTGNKKIIWGNPYVRKVREKGIGEQMYGLRKASGHLEISIDIDHTKAMELADMIKNAGVSSFYLGKKGLAYVSTIRI